MSANYHMIEYIREIPQVLKKTLAENEAPIQTIFQKAKEKGINKIIVIGVGSSYTAALIAAPVFRVHCPLPTYIFPSTELGPYMPALVDRYTLVVSVSRSGERGWVVDALKDSIRLGAMGIAVTGMPDSLLAQNAQYTLVTCEGPEVTFAKTKSVATCCGLLMQLALAFADPKDKKAATQLQTLRAMPAAMQETLDAVEPQVIKLMPEIITHKMVTVGGTVGNYGAALEFAIKLPEAAIVPVTGNDTGNILHGPWGLINPEWLTILMVTGYDLELSRKTLQLTGDLKGHRLVITEPGLEIDGWNEYKITLPKTVDLLAGLTYLLPLQLITYYWTVGKGLHPDKPEGMRTMLDAMLPPGREEPEMRA